MESVIFPRRTPKRTERRPKTMKTKTDDPGASCAAPCSPSEEFSCFECMWGSYETKIGTYRTTLANGQIVGIPHVPHEVCNECGDVVFGHDANQMIEAVVFKDRKCPDCGHLLSRSKYSGWVCTGPKCIRQNDQAQVGRENKNDAG